MVQVDVFWSYAIGAGIALASARQIRGASKLKLIKSFETKAFRNTILFLALLFAPSGIYLLTAFPHWETMHVARTLDDIPSWLATLFAFTNITQGILGFAIAAWFIRKGKLYGAYLQWIIGYFGMYFILVHGWDGTGYIRFFSARPELIDGWTWATAGSWVTSDVGLSLLAIGVFFLPTLLWLMSVPLKRGYELDEQVNREGAARLSAPLLALSVLTVNTVVILAVVVAGSLAIHALGWWAGGPIAVGIFVLASLKGSLFHRHFRHMMYADSLLKRTRALIPTSDPA